MKTNKSIFPFGVIVAFLAISSCDTELAEKEVSAQNSINVQTKASVSDQPIDYLNDIYNIPVNIYLPAGAAAASKRYLSASKKDVGINLVSEDSGSGRERWLLHNLSSNNQNHFSLKVQGGAYGHYLTIIEDMSHNKPNEYTYIYMYNEERPGYDNVSTSWRIVPVDNKFLIKNDYNRMTWWLNGKWYDSNWPGGNINPEPPVNDLLCRWAIEPVSEFVLQDIEYKPLDNSTNVVGELFPVVSYPLENNSDIPQNQTIESTANYSEKSTFSETQGVSTTNTLKIDLNFAIKVPSVVKIAELSGTISYSQSSTDSYQVTTGKEESKSYTYKRTISQVVPPHSKLYIVTTAKKFKPRTKYVGHFYSQELGRTIRLNGIWNGEQLYELKVEVYDHDGYNLGRYKDDGTFQVSNNKQKMDIESIKKCIANK